MICGEQEGMYIPTSSKSVKVHVVSSQAVLYCRQLPESYRFAVISVNINEVVPPTGTIGSDLPECIGGCQQCNTGIGTNVTVCIGSKYIPSHSSQNGTSGRKIGGLLSLAGTLPS